MKRTTEELDSSPAGESAAVGPSGAGAASAKGRGSKKHGALSAVESAAWVGLLFTYKDLMRGLDREMSTVERLSLSSYEVLMKLAEAPKSRLRMKDIAVSMVTSASGLTRVVDDLERQGYVERRKCATDGRGLDAVLTPAGRTAFRRAEKVFLAYLRRHFFDRLSADQVNALADIWAVAGKTHP